MKTGLVETKIDTEAVTKISTTTQLSQTATYLGELMPIKIVSVIKLEDKDIIYLRLRPDAAIHAKQQEQKQA